MFQLVNNLFIDVINYNPPPAPFYFIYFYFFRMMKKQKNLGKNG